MDVVRKNQDIEATFRLDEELQTIVLEEQTDVWMLTFTEYTPSGEEETSSGYQVTGVYQVFYTAEQDTQLPQDALDTLTEQMIATDIQTGNTGYFGSVLAIYDTVPAAHSLTGTKLSKGYGEGVSSPEGYYIVDGRERSSITVRADSIIVRPKTEAEISKEENYQQPF